MPASVPQRHTLELVRKGGWWKWIGLAGAAGVLATGAVVARRERQRQAYTPEQVRDRLRKRHAEAVGKARPDG